MRRWIARNRWHANRYSYLTSDFNQITPIVRAGRAYIFDLRDNVILCQVENRINSCSGITGLSSASDSATFISVSLRNELQQISFDGKQLFAVDLHSDGQIRYHFDGRILPSF